VATQRAPAFGALLSRLRQAAGLTQEELAERTGLSREGISALERGLNRAPRRATVALLADVVAVSLADRTALEAAARLGRTPPPPHPATPDAHAVGSHAWPLVGRVRELAALERHLAGEGPPLLLLAGEPGIGKSRLLHEACGVAQASGWTILRGGCAWRGGEHPYTPLLEALQGRLAGYSPHHAPARLRAALAGCAWLVRLLPELAELAVTPVTTWAPPAEQERRLMFAAVRRFLANVAGPAGALLVLDDLHWAGADALDLLASLVQGASGVAGSAEPAGGPPAPPLRVIGAYRDTEVRADGPLAALIADLGRDRLAATRRIAPLDHQEALALADELLADTQRAGIRVHERPRDATQRPELAERLYEQAGGVPYFLVSCAQALRTNGLDTSLLTPLDAGAPREVAQSIQQRIAGVPPHARELLGAAAIAGRVIPFALLVAVLRRPERDLLAALGALCHARLLEEVSAGVPGGVALGDYQFAHDLIRDVARADLTAAHRIALHRAIGEALEGPPKTDGKGWNGQRRRAAEVAYHFLEADEGARALPHVLLAGDQAEALYAHAEAEKHYRTAATLAHELGDQAREAEALEKLGGALCFVARPGCKAAARQALVHAIELYGTLDNVEGQARTLALLPQAHDGNSAQQGLALLEPLAPVLTQRGLSPRGQAMLHLTAGQLNLFLGRGDAAYAAAQSAQGLARQIGDHGLLADALRQHGHALIYSRRPADALPLLHEAARQAELARDLYLQAHALHQIPHAHLDLGRFAQGLAHLEHPRTLWERFGNVEMIVSSLMWQGEFEFYLGEWEQAGATWERALALLREIGSRFVFGILCMSLGNLRVCQGQQKLASPYLEQAIASAPGDPMWLRKAHAIYAEGELVEGRADVARARLEPLYDESGRKEVAGTGRLALLAWMYLQVGDETQAETLVEQDITGRGAQANPRYLAFALMIKGLLRLRQGRWQDATDALDEALAHCRAMPYPHGEAKTLYVYGQLHAATGEPNLASEKYRAALAICARLGEGLYRPRIERALGELNGDGGSKSTGSMWALDDLYVDAPGDSPQTLPKALQRWNKPLRRGSSVTSAM